MEDGATYLALMVVTTGVVAAEALVTVESVEMVALVVAVVELLLLHRAVSLL
jgi:hypothetical protein